MKIDVIIPTFNRMKTILRAVESVLAQVYSDYTLYVVDDGSTDETCELLKKYPQVNLLIQSNKGVSAARNFGVKNSQNEWISFLDSDDEWLPHKLKAQVECLKKSPVRFLHAEEIWIRNGTRVNPKVKHSKSGPDLLNRSLEFCLISPSTVIIKRELFNQHGGFDESMEVCEDFDLWNKILFSEEIGFLDDFVTKKYGGHEDQLSTKYPAMDYWRIKSLVKLLPSLDSAKRKLVIEVIQTKAPILLKGYLKHQNLHKHAEVLQLISTLGLSLN